MDESHETATATPTERPAGRVIRTAPTLQPHPSPADCRVLGSDASEGSKDEHREFFGGSLNDVRRPSSEASSDSARSAVLLVHRENLFLPSPRCSGPYRPNPKRQSGNRTKADRGKTSAMKVAVLSDVHSNWVALQAVLADLPDVDAMVCAGDVVGYNPRPAECVDAMVERDVPTVMGNHDRAVAGATSFGFNSMAQAGVEHSRSELDDDQLEWLWSLPDQLRVFDGRVRLVHGHPDDPDRYTYPEDFAPDLLDDEDVLVMGHTHVQHHEVYEEGIVMNPGSVGQPRDRDERAAYAILDLDGLAVEEHRVNYDIPAVQQAIDEAGLPERLGTRLANGH